MSGGLVDVWHRRANRWDIAADMVEPDDAIEIAEPLLDARILPTSDRVETLRDLAILRGDQNLADLCELALSAYEVRDTTAKQLDALAACGALMERTTP